MFPGSGILPLGSRSVTPYIFADVNLGSQIVADSKDPKHCWLEKKNTVIITKNCNL